MTCVNCGLDHSDGRLNPFCTEFREQPSEQEELMTEAKAYEPICWKCSDHGFLIVGYGESGSGSKQCPECKGRYIKRRKEAMSVLDEPKADDLEKEAAEMIHDPRSGPYFEKAEVKRMADFARLKVEQREKQIGNDIEDMNLDRISDRDFRAMMRDFSYKLRSK